MKQTKICPACRQQKPQKEFDMLIKGKLHVDKKKTCQECRDTKALQTIRTKHVQWCESFSAWFGGIPPQGIVYEF